MGTARHGLARVSSCARPLCGRSRPLALVVSCCTCRPACFRRRSAGRSPRLLESGQYAICQAGRVPPDAGTGAGLKWRRAYPRCLVRPMGLGRGGLSGSDPGQGQPPHCPGSSRPASQKPSVIRNIAQRNRSLSKHACRKREMTFFWDLFSWFRWPRRPTWVNPYENGLRIDACLRYLS